jgi:hypothetical protein
MTLSRIVVVLAVSASFATSAFAQQACAPGAAAAAIDLYMTEPFSARAWRKMTGLGEVGVEADSFGYANYAQTDAWRKLVEEIAPGNAALANPSYVCRMGYPLEVLQARIAKFGKASDMVKQWLRGQEQVLKACAGEGLIAGDTGLPTTLPPEALAMLQMDRAYQQAAALFYARPADAIPAFRAIAATGSPHKAVARYNVANLLANAKNVVEARKETAAILADPALASVHDITRELGGYIANLEDTPEGWTSVIDDTIATLGKPAKEITGNPKAETLLAKALFDIGYAGIAAKRDDWWVTNTLPEDATLSKAVADAARKHPIALWMMAGQSVNAPTGKAPWAAMGPKWRAWTTSYIDRALALQPGQITGLAKTALESLKAGTDDASRKALWDAAGGASGVSHGSCGDAPEAGAVALLALQAVRVSAMANRFDEVYSRLPGLKLEGTQALRQTILPAVMQHVLASGNVEEGRRLRAALLTDEFLASIPAKDEAWRLDQYGDFLAWIAEDEVRWIQGVGFTQQPLSSSLFNLLPSAKLRALSEDSIFSNEQKALLKRAAWTRNYARNIGAKAETTDKMLAANPALGAELAKVKQDYPGLSPARALALTIMRQPRFGILVNSPDWSDALEMPRENFAALDAYDPNDKNWWCPLEPDRQLGALRAEFDEDAGMAQLDDGQLKPVLEADAVTAMRAAREKLLRAHPMVKAINWKEVAALAQSPSAPKLFSQQAVRLGKQAQANDGAAAEALALAVRATRWGCRWHGGHKVYSKPAQELLQAKFAATTWAQQTPYWFDCTDTTYDKDYNRVQNCKPRYWPKQALPR